MTEQTVVEYVANCAWQLPLLAGGAWVMVKLARPAVRTEYWLWVAVLVMAVLLPLRGVDSPGKHVEQYTHLERQPPANSLPGTPALDESFPRDSGDATAVRQEVTLMSFQLREFRLRMSTRATHWFVGLFVLAMLFAGLRLSLAWRGARRLVREARQIALSPAAMRSFAEVAKRLGVELPAICESSEIAGPMIVGALRPVLLLPEGACEYDDEELRAALCHELAHIKRRDYLVNLFCEAIMLPASWHPVTNAVERRIQQTREMACDEMAAKHMTSGEGYARCLVSLTRRIMERPVPYQRTQAVGFFDRNMLEERVMRLTGEDKGVTMTRRSTAMRGIAGVIALFAVVGVTATCHVKPAFAAEVTEQTPAAVAPTSSAGAVVSTPSAKPSAQVDAGDPLAVAVRQRKSTAPVAIARGAHARVTTEPGEYVHRWKSHDGEPFAMVNHAIDEPSEEERQAVEDKLQDDRAESDAALLDLDLPDIKLDMQNLQIDQTQNQKVQRVMNDPVTKRHFEELQRKSIADAEKQIADLKIDPPHIDLSEMNPELQLQLTGDAMKDAQVQALLGSRTKGMSEAQIDAEIARGMRAQEAAMAKMSKIDKQIESGELKAKLQAAQRLLEDVQRKMDAMQKQR